MAKPVLSRRFLPLAPSIYTLFCGHEPYETDHWGKDHGVILQEFQNKEFPPLSNSAEDQIIRRCWNGEYSSVRQLWGKLRDQPEQEMVPFHGPEWLTARQRECEQIIKDGTLNAMGEF